MSDIELEGDWLIQLDPRRKSFFLTSLAHALTIVARDTYEVHESKGPGSNGATLRKSGRNIN